MARTSHSAAFTHIRDAVLALDDRDRARLAGLFGHMTVRPHRPIGELRTVLREIAALDDNDLERLGCWFASWVNAWGQMPRATGMRIEPKARRDPPGEPSR